MYTAEIGKLIYQRWKTRTGQNLSVKEYFDQHFFPIFFDSERYLMLANNSKFDQAYKQKRKTPLTSEVRQGALADFHEDVDTLTGREGHLFMGGYSRDYTATTASQISQVEMGFEKEDAYLSWLGMAAGIGVKGGVSLLIKDAKIIDEIVKGWTYYRRYIEDNDSLKPHQIDSWNGWWLIHRSKNLDNKEHRDLMASFPPSNAIAHKQGVSAFVTPPWLQVLFALLNITAQEKMIAYIYSFGQMNTSIGFVPIHLGDIQRLSTLYKKLFGTENYSRERKSLEELYETELGFFQACRMGAIGLQAIEPKGLSKYMAQREKAGKAIKINDTTQISFRIYQTWIIAMLNNEELLSAALEFAEALNKVGPSKRGKKKLSTAVDKVLESSSKGRLVDALAGLIAEEEFSDSPAAQDKEIFDRIVNEVVKMPATNVPLFTTLVRFKHAYLNL